MNNRHNYAFTVVELLIVVVIIGLFSFLTIPFGFNFYSDQVLEESGANLMNNLKLAQSHAMAGRSDSSWGIKFYPEDQGCDNCYVLFKGDSYNERDEAYDSVFNFYPGITAEGMSEIIFEKGTGDSYIIE